MSIRPFIPAHNLCLFNFSSLASRDFIILVRIVRRFTVPVDVVPVILDLHGPRETAFHRRLRLPTMLSG